MPAAVIRRRSLEVLSIAGETRCLNVMKLGFALLAFQDVVVLGDATAKMFSSLRMDTRIACRKLTGIAVLLCFLGWRNRNP
jgi:hypothetical protein